ncbi:MAG: GAF domain-containing SpoIIE family protein phosphatase [Anaerolineae bacterium]
MILDGFAVTLDASEAHVLAMVREFAEWETGHQAERFSPTDHDDVALRTYLLHQRTRDVDHEALGAQIAALKRFYAWATAGGLIQSDPFEEHDFDRPILTREQIRRRHEVLGADPHDREVARLRGLVAVAEHLNRIADVQGLLKGTLEILAQVLRLQTAWVFIKTESGIQAFDVGNTPPHDFALACAHTLPPALEQEAGRILTAPPDCHCQHFFRAGRLARAVNVVECTRLAEASLENGDTHGLLFHASVPLISQGRTLGLINVATSEWQLLTAADLEFLTAVGAQVTVALERAHLFDQAQAQRDHLERELQVAHRVQASLLPRELPEVEGFRFAADWRSAREVAGDFYDIFPLHEGRWGIVVGDVADKGAPAALYMAMTRALIRSAATRYHSPAHTLIQINERIATESSYDTFVTLFYAILDPATRTLTYANAGHNPPLLRRASGRIDQLVRTGHVVGAFSTLRLLDATVTLEAGDALAIYTDGVTDALDPDGQDYGMERLQQALRTGPAPAPDLLNHLSADLAAFTKTAPQPDDITYFVTTVDG